MPLNKSKGNMYGFVTHTWNVIKGECPHGCTYCYMKRWGKQRPVRFDDMELRSVLWDHNSIFVGSSCDMWANNIPNDWISSILDKCCRHKNEYLFQTKNPSRFLQFRREVFPERTMLGTTIETNRVYSCMGDTPNPKDRAEVMSRLKEFGVDTFVTIEPILDFDIKEFVDLLTLSNVRWINIGADSGRNELPEPPKKKIVELALAIREKFPRVVIKSNTKRIIG